MCSVSWSCLTATPLSHWFLHSPHDVSLPPSSLLCNHWVPLVLPSPTVTVFVGWILCLWVQPTQNSAFPITPPHLLAATFFPPSLPCCLFFETRAHVADRLTHFVVDSGLELLILLPLCFYLLWASLATKDILMHCLRFNPGLLVWGEEGKKSNHSLFHLKFPSMPKSVSVSTLQY